MKIKKRSLENTQRSRAAKLGWLRRRAEFARRSRAAKLGWFRRKTRKPRKNRFLIPDIEDFNSTRRVWLRHIKKGKRFFAYYLQVVGFLQHIQTDETLTIQRGTNIVLVKVDFSLDIYTTLTNVLFEHIDRVSESEFV